jgi:hypothetical protein
MAKPITEKIVEAKEKVVEVKKEKPVEIKKEATPAERELTVPEEIGFTAGKIWHALRDKELSLSKLKTATKAQPNLLMMGLGWLAREDKVEISKNKKTYSIRLK